MVNNTSTLKKQRDIGPELLRIFAMILIIFSHIATHGNIVFEKTCFNSIVLSVLTMGGKTGVNIFILITGYYSIKSKPTVKKAIVIISQTVFYSVVLYLISCAVGANSFRLKYCFYALIPFISNKGYWFITIYLLLYILIPFINGGLHHLTYKQHLFTICVFLFVWAILPNTYGALFGEQGYGISELGWFVLAYSAGAFLRMYPIKLSNHRYASVILWIVTATLMIVAKVIRESDFSLPGTKGTLLNIILDFISNATLYGPVAFIFAILSLIVFLQSKIKPRKFLYTISASTFGIYLIHDSAWLRRFIWDDIFKMQRFADSSFFIIDVFFIMLITFTCCSVIDILRKKLIEIPVFSSGAYMMTEKKCKEIFDKIIKAVRDR